jgi:hypothetical protein
MLGASEKITLPPPDAVDESGSLLVFLKQAVPPKLLPAQMLKNIQSDQLLDRWSQPDIRPELGTEPVNRRGETISDRKERLTRDLPKVVHPHVLKTLPVDEKRIRLYEKTLADPLNPINVVEDAGPSAPKRGLKRSGSFLPREAKRRPRTEL